MRPLFGSKRRPKVVGREDGVDGVVTEEGSGEAHDSAVKRPPLKSKKRGSARMSFGKDVADDGDSPLRATSRETGEKSALRRSALANSLAAENIATRQDQDRPSYSKEHLAELKSSTPSRRSPAADSGATGELDIASKFGTDVTTYSGGARDPLIPTEAEIREKKARRARLAKEQKYKSRNSDSSDSDNGEDQRDERPDSDDDEFRNQHDTISLQPSSSKYAEGRLARDDEDMMEDFDSFVDDGRLALGRRAQKEHQKKEREEIGELIAEAEGHSSESSDDTDRERRDEYEAAQTRKGMEGLQVTGSSERHQRARTPPKITPLPSLTSCLEKLQGTLLELENSKKEKIQRLEDIQREQQDIIEREADIQRLLKEAAEKYEKLRTEAGANGEALSGATTPAMSIHSLPSQRGLESFGNTPLRTADADGG